MKKMKSKLPHLLPNQNWWSQTNIGKTNFIIVENKFAWVQFEAIQMRSIAEVVLSADFKFKVSGKNKRQVIPPATLRNMRYIHNLRIPFCSDGLLRNPLIDFGYCYLAYLDQIVTRRALLNIQGFTLRSPEEAKKMVDELNYAKKLALERFVNISTLRKNDCQFTRSAWNAFRKYEKFIYGLDGKAFRVLRFQLSYSAGRDESPNRSLDDAKFNALTFKGRPNYFGVKNLSEVSFFMKKMAATKSEFHVDRNLLFSRLTDRLKSDLWAKSWSIDLELDDAHSIHLVLFVDAKCESDDKEISAYVEKEWLDLTKGYGLFLDFSTFIRFKKKNQSGLSGELIESGKVQYERYCAIGRHTAKNPKQNELMRMAEYMCLQPLLLKPAVSHGNLVAVPKLSLLEKHSERKDEPHEADGNKPHVRHTIKEREQALQYLDKGKSVKWVCKKFGIVRQTLTNWKNAAKQPENTKRLNVIAQSGVA